MVMQVISEQLDMRDGGRCDCFGEMTRKENKSDIANFLTVPQTGDMSNFKGRVAT